MTPSPLQSKGDTPADAAATPMLLRWWKQIQETLRVMAGTPRVIKLIWRSHPGFTVILLGANLILGLAPLSEMWITKLLIDAIAAFYKTGQTSNNQQSYVFGLLGLMALIRLLSNSMEPTVRLVQEHLGDYLVRDINLMILEKANSLEDITVFENPTFHDKLTRAQNEASHRPINLLGNITTISRASVGLVSMISVLIAFQSLLALAVVALACPHLIIQFKMQWETWSIQDHEIPEVRRMRYFGSVLTSTDYASEVRLFNLGNLFIKKYSEKFSEFQTSHAKLRRRHWLINFLLANLSAIGLVASYAYIVLSALASRISLGSLSLYLGATTQVEYQLEAIIWSMAQLYQGNLFINNMFEFLEIPAPMTLAPHGTAVIVPSKLLKGVEFEHVTFKYPDSERNVLDDVNFLLIPGQSIALVGENGAGKTTIVKLLSRLYEPTSGRILVDGIDLRDYDLNSWRANLSVIFQNYARFHMTAKENIGIGNVAFIDDLERVEAAAIRGSAAPLIDRLPNKYDTTLGRWFSDDKDKGSELSGGEWQKIALSRAFMRSAGKGNGGDNNGGTNSVDSSGDNNGGTNNVDNSGDNNGGTNNVDNNGVNTNDVGRNGMDSPCLIQVNDAQLLILDEPTSALDAQAEYDVYLQFHELTRGKTTFLISHRFSTVRMADIVLVLEKGKIIERGSHDELVAHAGEYARLYKLQADRYK
jgi:ATP-binding cassette subfamily B protein/ATP-binding cassette subfamily C protein